MEEFNPKIMGILNVTPDSFYDGGCHFSFKKAVEHGIKLYHDGADVIDIGGESSRPFAQKVDEKKELKRVIPVIRRLKNEIPIPLSIDTMKPNVAEAALAEGVTMINDVSGFRNPKMVALAAQADIPICVMHMKETPETMQCNPCYEEGIVRFLLQWIQEKACALMEKGIKRNHLFFDPGIGFGKTIDDNFKILHNLQQFKDAKFPILIGLSRKSLITKVIRKTASESLAATIALNTVLLLKNIDMIRVHDVKEHRTVIEILKKFNSTANPSGN